MTTINYLKLGGENYHFKEIIHNDTMLRKPAWWHAALIKLGKTYSATLHLHAIMGAKYMFFFMMLQTFIAVFL